jgi:hypothetical protein
VRFSNRLLIPALALIGAVAVAALALALLRPGSSGSPPASSVVTPAGPVVVVTGTVTAGPVCPVERSPEPSECAPRPVAGAVIVATFPGQGEAGRATSAADGSYRIVIFGFGTIVLTPQPVQGLMGVARPVTVTLAPMSTATVDFEYDTGIR